MRKQVIFLDRDGVINVCAAPHDYIKKPQEFTLLPGVGEAIAKLNRQHIPVIIITNQRGVARGLMTLADVAKVHAKMSLELSKYQAHFDDIYICPHEKGTCHCRKPDVGLFLQTEAKYVVDKHSSFMIGDSESDIQAGVNYGIKTISVGKQCFNGDYHFDDLLGAVNFILGGN